MNLKGGFVIIPTWYFDKVNAALIKFQNEVTDPKAMVLPTFNTVHDIVRSSSSSVPAPPLSDTWYIG